MHNRIFGLETEYGLLIKADQPEFSPSWIAHRIIDHLFSTKKHGVIDLHYRGYDEPPGNGGFLLNAGRMYVDMGHLEFASPECHSLWDMLTFDRAGDCLIQDCLDELGIADQVAIIKNNVDHETGATFGCHENFLVSRDFPFTQRGLGQLIPFLVTRQVFTGAGRVGMTRNFEGWIELEDIEGVTSPRSNKSGQSPLAFQISQRPDFIVNDFFEWVQNNRAIVNTRDEPLADPNRFRRLHLLVGDSNMAEEATLLKMGTTGLVLQLIEEGHVPKGLDLDDPVQTLRDISHDPTRQWLVTLSTGQQVSALEMQEIFWEAAAKQYAGQDEETDWVLTHWESVIREPIQSITKRFAALTGMYTLQPVAAFVLLMTITPAFGQENPEIPPEWLFSDETVDLAETDDDAPKFVVPPDPKLPYLDAIDRLEEDYGPYATELSDLYMGLGEVFMKEGEFEDARDAYHRGVMVVRVNSGPNSPEQTNLLYLIANIETLLDEPKQADKIIENIRFVNEQYYGEHHPELFPVYERVYDWYATARPLDVDESDYRDYLQVIDISQDMVDIHVFSNGLTLAEAAISYRRLAEAHFEAMRFAMAEDDWIDPRIIVSSDVPYRVTPGFDDLSMREHYKEGRDAFRQYLELVKTDPAKTPLDYAEALADLADWSLHFEKYRAARTLYEQAYNLFGIVHFPPMISAFGR